MTPRERTLALVLIGAVVLVVAGAGGYFLVLEPLQSARAAEDALGGEIADLEKQVAAQRQTADRLKAARVRSLPADEALARREYSVALERLIESAGIPKGYTITPKNVDNTARAVPEITKGKPVYTKVAYEVVFKRADAAALTDFLERYYRLGLLHQITNISIKKDEETGAKKGPVRNDLTVTFTTEAILVDGAENRRTLLPVPTAFAALGGGAALAAMTATPEGGRGVSPSVQVPVLATNPRNYDLIVRKDPFSGPVIDPPAVPFKLAKLSDVKIKPDATPDAVKVAVSGDGSLGAKVTAVASGPLFPEGALKVDPKTFAIELPKTSATEGSSTVAVIATSADGKIEKGSFKVSVEETPPPPPDVGEDLSAVIVLIGVTTESDGTAWARVLDNANRYRYQIDATPQSVKVRKETLIGPGRPWRTDSDHDKLPAGVMQLSATTKSTRTLKVVAVNSDGLVVADLRPTKPDAAKAAWPPRPGRQGPGHPLAALGGNMVVAVPAPKYYRWPVGQPLSGIKPLKDGEVQEILKTAAVSGPVFDVAVAP